MPVSMVLRFLTSISIQNTKQSHINVELVVLNTIERGDIDTSRTAT